MFIAKGGTLGHYCCAPQRPVRWEASIGVAEPRVRFTCKPVADLYVSPPHFCMVSMLDELIRLPLPRDMSSRVRRGGRHARRLQVRMIHQREHHISYSSLPAHLLIHLYIGSVSAETSNCAQRSLPLPQYPNPANEHILHPSI